MSQNNIKNNKEKVRGQPEKCLHFVRPPISKNALRARPPSKNESVRCENEAFVRDLPHKMEVEDVKTKLSCKTSLKKWKWKM